MTLTYNLKTKSVEKKEFFSNSKLKLRSLFSGPLFKIPEWENF